MRSYCQSQTQLRLRVVAMMIVKVASKRGDSINVKKLIVCIVIHEKSLDADINILEKVTIILEQGQNNI